MTSHRSKISSTHNTPGIKGGAFLLLATLVFACPSAAHAGEKPPGWAEAVESAGAKKPLLWIDGTPYENRGEELGGELKYPGTQWAPPSDGFWGEPEGSFAISEETPKQSAVLAQSETTSIGCSPDGAMAILFRMPSEFVPGTAAAPDKIFLVSRGAFGSPSAFEVAIVNSKLRIAAPGATLTEALKPLPQVDPGTWYWLAISWKSGNGQTEVEWRLADRGGGLVDQGGFTSGVMGDAESRFAIGGSYRTSSADTLFSQIIVWDTSIPEEGFKKLEALLK